MSDTTEFHATEIGDRYTIADRLQDPIPASVPISASVIPALFEAVDDPLSSAKRVGDVVASEPGLAASVLAVANSAAFGRGYRIAELGAAVAMIGVNLVQTLAIARSTRLLDGIGGLADVRDHAIETACAARLLAAHVDLPSADAFAAGLLHDVGQVLLWQQHPDDYATAHEGWEDIDTQLRDERHLFGADHASAAREQLAEWRLPGSVVDAVGDHHRPDLRYRDLSTVVAAAETLVEADDTDADPDRLGLGDDVLQAIRDEGAEQSRDVSALLDPFGLS